MQASGTRAQPDPSAPPPSAAADEEKLGAGWRLLCVLLAAALAFGAAVMLLLPLNPDDVPRCEQAELAAVAGECYDLTKTQQTIQNILAWPAGILGALAALMALVVAATGRHLDTLRRLTIPALALGILAVIVGQL